MLLTLLTGNWRVLLDRKVFPFQRIRLSTLGPVLLFGQDHIQKPKATLQIHFFWSKKSIWNDKGDAAELLDAEGKSVSKREEKPPKYEASIAIQKLDLIGDFVSVVNKGSKDQDLTNWFIKSIIGSQRFVFPKGSVLKCGTTVTVWSGKDADKRQHPPTSLFWTKKFIWNNEGDSCALYNAEGDVVSTHSEFPVNIASHVAPAKTE